MKKRIRIAIDPMLKQRYGPEICWVWRLLFRGMGICWEEVSVDSPEYEIAYLAQGSPSGNCRLCIRANTRYWEHRSTYRLGGVGQTDDWLYPVFKDESGSGRFFHINDGRIVFEKDIIFYVFWIVTGQEEIHFANNKYGQINLKESLSYQSRALRLALASAIGFGLEKELLKLGFSPAVARWPNGKKAAACVGHDVDYPEVNRLLEPLRIMQRQGLSGFKAALSILNGKRNHWNFASWVSMEKELNIKSAFYFTAKQGSLYKYATGIPDPLYDVGCKRFKEVLRYLTDEGFEIGLHASYCAFEDRDKFAMEKRLLEKVSHQPICGNRHHYWHMDPQNPESTLLLHEKINLRYDTSLAHEYYVGWRRGLSWPFYPFHQRQRREINVLQVPTVWMDNQFFGYQKYNSGDRHAILRQLSDKAAEQGGCILVDIHDYIFDDVLFPGWADTYSKFFQYLRERSDFWIQTPGRIADYWINRSISIMEASQGLEEGYVKS